MRCFTLLFLMLTLATHAQTWTTATSIPEAVRAGNTTAYTKNGEGYLFVISGRNQEGTLTFNNQRYQLSTNAWTSMAPHPTAIISGATAAIKDSIYVIAGVPASPPGNFPSRRVYRYSINEDSWAQKANFPTTLTDAEAVPYQDSLIYVIGGVNIGRTRLYNTVKNQWRNATDMIPSPGGISFGALAVRNDTLVYMCGGRVFLSSEYYNTVRIGVIDQNDRSVITWTEAAPFPGNSRSFFDAWPWRDGLIMTGGSTDNTFGTSSNECYYYNVGADTWTQLPSKPTAWNTGNSGSVLINNEWKLICAGGYSNGYLDETEIFSEGTLASVGFNTDCGREFLTVEKSGLLSLQFCLKENSLVQATIYDMTGRIVKSEKETSIAAGNQSMAISTSGFSKGIYYIALSVNGNAIGKKIPLGN